MNDSHICAQNIRVLVLNTLENKFILTIQHFNFDMVIIEMFDVIIGSLIEASQTNFDCAPASQFIRQMY